MLSKLTATVGLAILLCWPLLAAAADPSARCIDSKAKAAGKKAATLLKALGRNVAKATDPRLAASLSKIQSKFTRAFTKAEGDGGCPTNGDVSSLEAKIDAFALDVYAAMPIFVDNGDGTITDFARNLMWEKKSNDGGIHDRDTRIPWTNARAQIDRLNECCDGDAVTPCTTNADCVGIGSGLCGFAGYRNWRLPEVDKVGGARELDALLITGVPEPKIYEIFKTPCTPGCSVTTCSCADAAHHWSGTEFSLDPTRVWELFFGDGLGHPNPYPREKDAAFHWRAVRELSPSFAFIDRTDSVLD